MAYFAVNYQLNNQKDYQPLWDELERLGGHRALRSFWFLDLNTDSAESVRSHLAQYLDNDDSICVIPMDRRPAPHKCNQGTTPWLEARF